MRKLLDRGEIWLDDKFHHLVVSWTEGPHIYQADIPNLRMRNLDAEAVNEAVGTRIPDNHIYPPWHDGITEMQQPVPPEVYIKTPSHLCQYYGTSHLADQAAAEVEILETISKKPHPNVCTYYGCIRDGDLVRGICLQKYKYTLQDVIEACIPADQCPLIDRDAIITGIKAGLDHIHSFGLVHDDINPSNIMLDSSGNPVIVDFDSCVVVGAPSRGGTPGWSKYPDIAAVENDMHGFKLVAKFVQGEYDGSFIHLP